MTTKAAPVIEMETLSKTTPPLTAVLTKAQLAAWLQIGINTLSDDLDLPTIGLTPRNPRYSVRQVLKYLEQQAEIR